MMRSELETLSSVPNPEEEEEAILPKKDLLDGPALIRRPSSSSEVLDSDLIACGVLSPNSQDSSSSSSASSNSNGDDLIRPTNKEEDDDDETPVQRVQDRRQEAGIMRSKNSRMAIPKLEVKLSLSSSCSGEIDGMKTPTSPGSKIPSILSCPGAPRKPMSRPIYTKRTLAARRALFQDESDEIQSLFSGGQKKMKKARLAQP